MIRVRVIIKRPGEKPYCTNVSTSDENLKRIVEGELRHVAITSDVGLIVNRAPKGELSDGIREEIGLQGLNLLGVVPQK